MTDLHPEALIDRMIAGTLDGERRATLHHHLRECPACRLELATRRAAARHTAVRPGDRDRLARATELALARATGLPLSARGAAPFRLGARAGFFVGAAAGLVLLLALGLLARWDRARAMFDAPADMAPHTQADRPDSHATTVGTASSSAATRTKPRPSGALEPAIDSATPLSEAPTSEMPTDATDTAPNADDDRDASAPAHRPRPQRTPRGEGAAVDDAATPDDSTDALGELPADASVTPASMFALATAAERAGERSRALRLFTALRERFPASREATTSWVVSGRLHLAASDHAAALRCFEAYLAADGPRPLTPEATAGRAHALEGLGRKGEPR